MPFCKTKKSKGKLSLYVLIKSFSSYQFKQLAHAHKKIASVKFFEKKRHHLLLKFTFCSKESGFLFQGLAAPRCLYSQTYFCGGTEINYTKENNTVTLAHEFSREQLGNLNSPKM